MKGDVTFWGFGESQLVYLACQRWCIATQALPDRAEPIVNLGRRLDGHGEIPNLDCARLASSWPSIPSGREYIPAPTPRPFLTSLLPPSSARSRPAAEETTLGDWTYLLRAMGFAFGDDCIGCTSHEGGVAWDSSLAHVGSCLNTTFTPSLHPQQPDC